MRFPSIATLFALSAVTLATAAIAQQTPTLVTPDQQKIDLAAISLLGDPAIISAREGVVKSWSALPAASLKDGKAQLEGAVDDLVYFSAKSAVERTEFSPAIVWTLTPPYAVGAAAAPGGRFGIDTPDRIYRSVTVTPALRYVIRGQRSAQPSNGDFLFEVYSNVDHIVGSLRARDIDVGADGGFTVTVDSTPSDGRRNHLTLPEGASSLLIRDTLADWNNQLPNRLTIEVVGGGEPPRGGLEQTKAVAAAALNALAQVNVKILGLVSQIPVNEIKLTVRSGDDGVEGAIIGAGRFSIKDDEALVVTLDPQTAAYLGVQLTDPWARSIPYWDNTSSLSERQAKKNPDGTITYIVSPRDPGYFNWLDTKGLNDGLIAVRFEDFGKVDIEKIVRQWKLVKASDLQQNLPAGAERVTPAERAAQLATRKAGFEKRLTN